MPFNTYVLTDISLYAKYIWKIHNNRTEHKILNFRRNNIWLVCHAAFVLGNLLRYFANGWDAGRASTQDSYLILLPSTSNIFWFGFFLSLDRAHCCFVGFGLTMRYPVSGHKGVVAVDINLFSRDFGAWAAYKVPFLNIEDYGDQIVENITLPSLSLGIS